MKSILSIMLICVSMMNFAATNEKEPVLINKLGVWITSSLFYPANAIDDRTEGTVYVSFSLDENQKIAQVNIEEGVSEELNQKALEIVMNLQVNENQFVSGKKYILPVKFVIK